MSELDVHVPDFAPAEEPAPPSGRFRVFSYLTAPHAERYVQIMELFVTHKRFIYVQPGRFVRLRSASYKLEDSLDRGLLKRFDSAT